MKHLKHYGKEDPMWEDFLAQEERHHEEEFKTATDEFNALKAMTIKELSSDYFWLNNIYKKHLNELGITPETREVWKACSEYLDEHVDF